MNFFHFLVLLYPCRHCADDYAEYMESNPPRVDSRQDLMMYCCEMHNAINEKLGLPIVACDLERLEERWGEGRPDC